MRRALLAALCAVLFAAPVLAEDGPICIFSDATGSSCSFTDTGGLMEFYVIHQPDDGVAAVQFSAPVPGCMTGASWLGDKNPYLTIGNSQTGMAVSYGGCVTGPTLVSTIQVATTGLTSADCPYPVLPDPAASTGYIEVVDCASVKHLGTGGTAYINSALDCKCGPGPGDPTLDASPLVVTFGENDNTMPLALTNIGAGTLTWEVLESITWLTPAPSNGSGDQTVNLNVDRAGLQIGHYTEAIWVASNGGNATITIELDVGANPILGVNPTSLSFAGPTVLKSLTVFNAGTGSITWSIDPPDVGWLSVDPPDGVGTTRVDVTVDRTGLATGTYNATLHVTSDGGDIDVPVHMVVSTPATLGYSPAAIDFGTSQNTAVLNIVNQGSNPLAWSITAPAPWVTVSHNGGIGDATIQIFADRIGGLPSGYHSTSIEIASNGGNASVPVSMLVEDAQLFVNPTLLVYDFDTTELTFSISSPTGTIFWEVDWQTRWIASATPSSGSGDGMVTVTVDRSGVTEGSYSGWVRITSNGGEAVVRVRMLGAAPILYHSYEYLDFGTSETTRQLGIENYGGGTLEWSMTTRSPWVTVNPDAGTGDAIVLVSVHRDWLSPGDHTSVIDITSNGGDATIPVTVTIPEEDPRLDVWPISLVFAANQTRQSINVSNGEPQSRMLIWNAAPSEPWMSVFPDTGGGPATLTVNVDRTGLPDGNYAGLVQVTSNGGNRDVSVAMVIDSAPQLGVNPASLEYSNADTLRTFQINNLSGGTLEWQVSADQPWIRIDPPLTGTGNATVPVSVDLSGIAGTHMEFGQVTVASNGGVGVVDVRYVPPASGDPHGTIAIFSDPGFTSCAIEDVAGAISLYVVHQSESGATSVQFSAPIPACWSGAAWISDTNTFPSVVGNSQDGMSVSFGDCNGPVHVTTINVISSGTAGACCEYPVLPDPGVSSGRIEAVDCVLNRQHPYAPSNIINEDASCPCGTLVSVETKTWGGVKALYLPDEGEKR